MDGIRRRERHDRDDVDTSSTPYDHDDIDGEDVESPYSIDRNVAPIPPLLPVVVIGAIVAVVMLAPLARDLVTNTTSWMSSAITSVISHVLPTGCVRRQDDDPEKPLPDWLVGEWVVESMMSVQMPELVTMATDELMSMTITSDRTVSIDMMRKNVPASVSWDGSVATVSIAPATELVPDVLPDWLVPRVAAGGEWQVTPDGDRIVMSCDDATLTLSRRGADAPQDETPDVPQDKTPDDATTPPTEDTGEPTTDTQLPEMPHEIENLWTHIIESVPTEEGYADR